MPYLLFQQHPFQTDFIHAVNMGLLWYAFQKQTEIGTMLTNELLSTLSFAIHGNHLFFKHLNIQKPSSQIANLAVPQQSYCGNWVSWVLDKGSDPYVLGRWSFISTGAVAGPGAGSFSVYNSTDGRYEWLTLPNLTWHNLFRISNCNPVGSPLPSFLLTF